MKKQQETSLPEYSFVSQPLSSLSAVANFALLNIHRDNRSTINWNAQNNGGQVSWPF